MLITHAQGLACLRAAERIAEGADSAKKCDARRQRVALEKLGWGDGYSSGWYFRYERDGTFNRAHAMLALTWCATIAGEA